MIDNNCIVRLAGEEELSRVNELRRQVNDLHVEGRPDIFRPGFGDEIQDILYTRFHNNSWHVFVAMLDGVLCGFACVEFVDRPESTYNLARRFCRVEEFGVDADFRRRGVAKALMESIRMDAASLGYQRIELDMWEFNADALAFYEAFGFRTFRRYMELESGECV